MTIQLSQNLRIKNVINDSKITKAQLAKELGVSRAYITMIANGKRKPSQDIARRLHEFFVNKVNTFECVSEWGSEGPRFKSGRPDHKSLVKALILPSHSYAHINTPVMARAIAPA